MSPQLRKWFITAFIGSIIMGFFIWISPSYMPQDDVNGLYRYFILHIPVAIFALLTLIGAVFWLDEWTEGDWFKKIYESPLACAIVVAILFLSVALIVAFV